MSCIRLVSIGYSERVHSDLEWVLEPITLSQVNLLVGKNATGKSRTISVIFSLAKLLSPSPKFLVDNGSYVAEFDDNGVRLRYELSLESGAVNFEKYSIDGRVVLSRSPEAIAKIETHGAEGGPSMTPFSPPMNELAVLIRRDAIQHPYLERLHEWALSVRCYMFGSALGKDNIGLIVKDAPDADDRDFNQVVGIFRKAEREFGPKLIDAVKSDMAEMQYAIEDIKSMVPTGVVITSSVGDSLGGLSCIGVKENGVVGFIEQTSISQGMFRALSILVQVNYSQMANRASCILIDDIGEGLDFERSTRLIGILRKKAAAASFQLIMTTNDKFVMNNVPLTEWLVLQRQGGVVRCRDYRNSKQLFDDFKFTGLSNFSFLEMDFLSDDERSESAI